MDQIKWSVKMVDGIFTDEQMKVSDIKSRIKGRKKKKFDLKLMIKFFLFLRNALVIVSVKWSRQISRDIGPLDLRNCS